MQELLEKIFDYKPVKKPADLLYEKPTNGKSPAGDDAYARDLAISDNTQSSINIPQSLEDVKRNIAKANNGREIGV